MPVNTVMPFGVDDFTNRSGVIATGGTPQQAAAAFKGRIFLLIQNPSTEVESLWVRFGATATVGQPSIEITPGNGLVLDAIVPRSLVSVVAATNGHTFVLYER